jgi:hypothetical protein
VDCGVEDRQEIAVLMITRDIRAFMGRDWQAVRNHKDDYWAARIARLGVGEALRIADELRRQALQGPNWPSAESREQDLLAHAHLAALLRRASPAGSR